MKRIRTLFLAVAACLVCVIAHAQWQWIDKDGRKVFSDRAPPPSIPAKSILKQPNESAPTVAVQPAPNPGAAIAAAVSGAATNEPGAGPEAPKLGTVDKELADKKKLADTAVAAKAKAQEERVAKAKVDNCERAKSNKALMESGVRVSQTDSKGERMILDDSGRAAEIKRAQTVIDASCR